MTLVTTPSVRERLNNNFVNLFKAPSRTDEANSFQKLPPVIERLVKNELLAIKSIFVSKADAIFLVNRYEITFSLSNKFAEHFVLLRGLIEFSKPKTIRITASRTDNTFHLSFSEGEADHFVAHLEKILDWLVREIRFKKSLKALVNFEKKVKREQEILYANLKLTA